jgi:L-asparaginase
MVVVPMNKAWQAPRQGPGQGDVPWPGKDRTTQWQGGRVSLESIATFRQMRSAFGAGEACRRHSSLGFSGGIGLGHPEGGKSLGALAPRAATDAVPNGGRPMKPKVVLISTGGTIASRYDEKLGRTVASQRGEDLLAQVPQLAEVAAIEIDDFATVPSFDMSAELAFRLAARINLQLARADVAGVVVTHGTDTMEESCYLADLLLPSDKPAVFTGAQRAHDDPNPDGPDNILGAVRTAAAPDARGLGAVICFADQIHAARDVTKVSASALAAFQSYDKGALGEVDAGRVVLHRRPQRRRTFVVERLETRVWLLRLCLGFEVELVRATLERGAKGLVIEAFGRGNGPAALVPIVRDAVAAGVPVVVTSRCPSGRVEPIYGRGGGKDLADAGAIFAGDLKGAKARLLLMLLLAAPETRHRIAEVFHDVAP